MNRTLLKSKIHRATITEADVEYEGSLGIDALLMESAHILEFEQIQIYNITNGQRFVTYAIRQEGGSGAIQVNGAAARLAVPGDKIIIASYAQYDKEELSDHRPIILLLDEDNKPIQRG